MVKSSRFGICNLFSCILSASKVGFSSLSFGFYIKILKNEPNYEFRLRNVLKIVILVLDFLFARKSFHIYFPAFSKQPNWLCFFVSTFNLLGWCKMSQFVILG